MKDIIIKVLFLVFILTFIFGTCDHTVLRGEIITSETEIKVGQKVKLELEIPQELDGIHRISWYVEPATAGEIEYVQYEVKFGEEEYGKEDRIAYFTAKEIGKCTISVYGFYKQTNPQPITYINIAISE